MGGTCWVAVLVCDAQGAPVGFELALERQLRLGELELLAYYASIFSVSVEHRRRGLGRWILEGINRLVFEERGADLIVSTFHGGHAGSPAVQSTFDRIEGWGGARFHQGVIWSRRLDRDPLPPMPAPRRLGLLEMAGETASQGLESRAIEGAPLDEPDVATLDAAIRGDYATSFALEASLGRRYLHRDNSASGLLMHDTGSGGLRLSGFNILPMSINDRRLRPVGQLQLVVAPGATDDELEAMVHEQALYLAERGCFALSLVDTGQVPTAVLDKLGFVPTDDRITFAARGPVEVIEAFEGLEPPFFLDFT
jgi:hypothetical protein